MKKKSLLSVLFAFFFALSCGSSHLETALETADPVTVLPAALAGESLGPLVAALEKRLDRGAEWAEDATNCLRLRLLTRAIAALPGGSERAVKAYARLAERGAFAPGIRSGFSGLVATNRDALLGVIRKANFQTPPPVLGELVALLGGAADEALYAEFRKLLDGYDIAPTLFRAAFQSLPLRRFHDCANFSKKELHDEALRRLRAEWRCDGIALSNHAAVRERVRFFVSGQAPMLAVIFIRTLATGSALAPAQADARFLYGLTEDLRDTLAGRSEDELMEYADLLARLYRARD